ncbi:hypothetical protein LX32DRAFT_634251 [Colletotrichum zoysiae]|uniref:Uncharacterized protein n=1 Tax=Colletotrichum zoysiae TaxID=1216348 RepID=A0AAD9HUB0_9PEZI|nr:hypothetical protein LX32DRAFT_634251 [Colletotrichum zoysiae]
MQMQRLHSSPVAVSSASHQTLSSCHLSHGYPCSIIRRGGVEARRQQQPAGPRFLFPRFPPTLPTSRSFKRNTSSPPFSRSYKQAQHEKNHPTSHR